MTSKDMFGCAVRIIGFWFAAQAALYFFARVPVIVSAMNEHLPLGAVLEQFAGGIAQAIIGGWILLKADSIVGLIYGARVSSPPAP